MAKSAVKLRATAISNGALNESELPSRIKVLNWGESKTLDDPIKLDEESARVFYANQNSIGRAMVPLDFNHNTVPGTTAYEADKEPRAVAAYGVPTIIKGEGMFLDYLRWTPSGLKSARDFADLSPAVMTDKENRVIGMHSVALTPAGAIENLHFYSAETMTGLMDIASSKSRVFCDGHSPDCDCDECKARRGELKVNSYASKSENHYSKYGDVDYADPDHKKYPINTEAHVRAAWTFIHEPKNQKGYSAPEVAGIKDKISAKAKHYGIELRAESADAHVKTQVNAYIQTPYNEKGIDAMVGEDLKYMRAKLSLGDDATPDDIMKFLRAKWEGEDTADKQPLPLKTPGASVDPQIRNGPALDRGRDQPTGTISYSADDIRKQINEGITAAIGDINKVVAAQVAEGTKVFSAEIEALRKERDAKVFAADEAERANLIAEASRTGKVIPLSAEEVKTVDLKILRSIVGNAKPEVPIDPRQAPVRPLSAADSKPDLKGSLRRGAEGMSRWFSAQGVKASGKVDLNPRPPALPMAS